MNTYNGCNFGLDVSSSLFVFNNMATYGVVSSGDGVLGDNQASGSLLQFYATRNYIKLDSGNSSSSVLPYNWKIFIQDDDTVSKNVGINKSLVFLSPSGKGYFLRDDAVSADASNATGSIQISASSFTGQHSVILSENISQSDVGKIVVSTGQYNNFSYGVRTNLPNMNESLPVVEFTTQRNDARCFGVISTSTKIDVKNGVYTYNQGAWSSQLPAGILENRCWVNSIGEGAIYVSNANGNLKNGDFITTSEDAGFGVKQDDDLLHSYTVAKITEDMDFTDSTRVLESKLSSGNIRKICLVGCTYHCG